MVMGRNTFEKVLSFPEWPYEGKRVVVMIKSLVDVPDLLTGKIEISTNTPNNSLKN